MSTVASAGDHKAAKLPLWGLLALATTAFMTVMTELLPAGLLPQMSRAFHVSEGRAGFLVSGYAAASCLAAIPLTAALVRVRRRVVLVSGLAGFAVANLVTAASSSYPVTFGARVLAGTMSGMLWAMLAGYAARMVVAERRGRAIAIVMSGVTVALSLGIPAAAALAATLGWRAAFASMVVLAVVLMGWAWWKVPDFPGQVGGRVRLRRIAATPGLPIVLGVTLCLLAGHQAVYTYLAPLTVRSGFGRTGVVLFVFGAATMAGVSVTGILVDRHLRSSLLVALTLIAAAMLTIGAFGHLPAVLLVSVAVWGFAFGGAPALLQTVLINFSGPEHADAATSMQSTVYNLGIAGGALIGGLVLDNAGVAAVPWTAFPLIAAALGMATAVRPLAAGGDQAEARAELVGDHPAASERGVGGGNDDAASLADRLGRGRVDVFDADVGGPGLVLDRVAGRDRYDATECALVSVGGKSEPLRPALVGRH